VRTILEAGFIFWGLFGLFGLIVALYVLWMWWVEKKDEAGLQEPEVDE